MCVRARVYMDEGFFFIESNLCRVGVLRRFRPISHSHFHRTSTRQEEAKRRRLKEEEERRKKKRKRRLMTFGAKDGGGSAAVVVVVEEGGVGALNLRQRELCRRCVGRGPCGGCCADARVTGCRSCPVVRPPIIIKRIPSTHTHTMDGINQRQYHCGPTRLIVRRWFPRFVAMNDWLIHARTGVTRHAYQQAAEAQALAAATVPVERCVYVCVCEGA